MSDRINIPNGPYQFLLEECQIGSQVPIAVYLDEETAPGSGVFAPFDYTGISMACHVKDNPDEDVTPDATFTCTPRLLEPGWVDLVLLGTATDDFRPHTYQASLKIWPTASPEFGDTVAVFYLPFVFRATR